MSFRSLYRRFLAIFGVLIKLTQCSNLRRRRSRRISNLLRNFAMNNNIDAQGGLLHLLLPPNQKSFTLISLDHLDALPDLAEINQCPGALHLLFCITLPRYRSLTFPLRCLQLHPLLTLRCNVLLRFLLLVLYLLLVFLVHYAFQEWGHLHSSWGFLGGWRRFYSDGLGVGSCVLVGALGVGAGISYVMSLQLGGLPLRWVLVWLLRQSAVRP